jgi:hydrogenase expression/formation protein HypD
MAALLATPTLKIDGFINPGHVSAIIGTAPYKQFKLPQVIAGFEANDVLMTIYMLLKQIAKGRTEVENEYTRLVRPEGNPKARELISEVFETSDAYWRGIGKIPNSGLEIRPKYSEFNAKIKYKKILETINCEPQTDSSGCICGAILRGLKEPRDCKLFNKKCTPDNPVGACMVSSEGACGIAAKFSE